MVHTVGVVGVSVQPALIKHSVSATKYFIEHREYTASAHVQRPQRMAAFLRLDWLPLCPQHLAYEPGSNSALCAHDHVQRDCHRDWLSARLGRGIEANPRPRPPSFWRRLAVGPICEQE